MYYTNLVMYRYVPVPVVADTCVSVIKYPGMCVNMNKDSCLLWVAGTARGTGTAEQYQAAGVQRAARLLQCDDGRCGPASAAKEHGGARGKITRSSDIILRLARPCDELAWHKGGAPAPK